MVSADCRWKLGEVWEKENNAENTTLLTVPVIAKERNMEAIRTPSLGRIWTPTEQAISGHSVPFLYVN